MKKENKLCKPIMWGMLGTITLYFLYIIYRILGVIYKYIRRDYVEDNRYGQYTIYKSRN